MDYLNDRFHRMDITPPTKVARPGALVENNRWKADSFSNGKEHLSLKNSTSTKNNTNEPHHKSDSSGRGEVWRRRTGSSSSASERIVAMSPSRVHTIKLVGGLESFESARNLHETCLANDSMLQNTLERIGFHGSVEDENSNMNSTNSYKVVVKQSNRLRKRQASSPKIHLYILSHWS